MMFRPVFRLAAVSAAAVMFSATLLATGAAAAVPSGQPVARQNTVEASSVLAATASFPVLSAATVSAADDEAEASSASLVTFGLKAASAGTPDPRGYLSMSAAPGAVIYDTIAVVNQSDEPLELDVYSADAVNAADGAIGLPDRSQAPTGPGTWVTVNADHVTVPPQSDEGFGYVLVPVTITIPVDAEPGDHLAGVVASLLSEGTTSGGDQSATVNLEQRVGMRLYINVAGDLVPALAITDLHATYHQASFLGLAIPGTATVTYTVHNIGNTRLNIRTAIGVSGLFGLVRSQAQAPDLEEVLPGSSIEQQVELPVWPLVREQVSVVASGAAPVAASEADLPVVAVDTWMWAVPWAYLVLMVLLLISALVLWWQRRRSARNLTSAEQAP